MTIDKKTLEDEVFGLLRDWGDGLLRHQLDLPGRPEYDGGILCPACMMIHGRCHDAFYPLLCLADRTGEERYLRAAMRLFSWGANMLNDDGSLDNDAHSAWNGTTVFNAVALHDGLVRHGTLLDAASRTAVETRMALHAEWLHSHLVPGMGANINYFATNACAMALLGNYFDREDYRELARTLADLVCRHIDADGLLFGEGHPTDAQTARGCRAVDVGGYNVEESLPSLLRYAETLGDREAYERCRASFRAHLEWMLPDGAWDNSVGTRTFKWTYWGSRTSDGCQEALFRLGREDPVFAEAAWRNLQLYRRCTADGLLYGGPGYRAHGEPPCTHHTFCHAKTLAGALDEGLAGFERVALPADVPSRAVTYWRSMDTWRLAVGEWLADVTAGDFNYMPGGHASGGTMSLLWHRRLGPVIATGCTDYILREVNNQQLTKRKSEHRSLCPRVQVRTSGGSVYGQQDDYDAQVAVEEKSCATGTRVDVCVSAKVCDKDHRPLEGNDAACALEYALEPAGLRISGRMAPAAEYILPVIADEAEVSVEAGTLAAEPARIFNLNPGFEAREFRIRPDTDGNFAVRISAPDKR